VRVPVHLLDEHASQPDRGRLVQGRGHDQPGLLPDRGRAQPRDHWLGRDGAPAGLRGRAHDRRRVRGARVARARSENGADVTRAAIRIYRSVALGIAWRTAHNALTTPNIVIPTLAFPFFFFVAFAGGLSQLQHLPGFDFEHGYTAFQFVFVMVQAAAFGGVFTGFGIARDFEYGFARRLMIAAPYRSALVLGYALSAIVRWAVVATLLTVAAFAVGMDVGGGGVELPGLYGLAVIVNMTALLWSAGIAMRLRTIQAGPAMQMPVFLELFFAPVYVPLTLL